MPFVFHSGFLGVVSVGKARHRGVCVVRDHLDDELQQEKDEDGEAEVVVWVFQAAGVLRAVSILVHQPPSDQ